MTRDFHRLPTGAWATEGPAPVDSPWKSLRAPLRRRTSTGTSGLRAADPRQTATVTKYGRSNWVRPGRPKHGIPDTTPFFTWYKTDTIQFHAGIATLTPHDLLYGRAHLVLGNRERTLRVARDRSPERFVHGIPKAQPLPDEVCQPAGRKYDAAARSASSNRHRPNVVDSFRTARLEGAAELPPRFLIDRERGETT